MAHAVQAGALRLERAAPMTAEEARDITNRINQAAGELWRLLLEAYERQAWRALGYASWKAYVESEFTITRQRAYQLLDQGRVIRLLQEAAGDVSTTVDISERAARGIKPSLPEVTAQIRERVESGAAPEEAVREVVDAHRKKRCAPESGPAPEPAPEPDTPDDADVEVDPIAEWERAEKRIEELEALVASLQSNDLAREVAVWRQKYAQLEGRLHREMATRAEAEREAKYAKKKLAEIRRELGVVQDRDIIPAIQTLREWAGA